MPNTSLTDEEEGVKARVLIYRLDFERKHRVAVKLEVLGRN